MKPTIGRIVHFYDHSRPRDASGRPGPFAAIITAVKPLEFIDVTVFPPGYPPVSVPNVKIRADDETLLTYCEWPPRVETPFYDASAELPRGHHAALGMAKPEPIAPADAGDTSTTGN